MTDEMIVAAAKEHGQHTEFKKIVGSPISRGVNSAYGIGFLEGAVWYRDSIWHDGSETPNLGTEHGDAFLIQWEDGIYDITGYSTLTWRTIKRWAFLKDITD